MEGNPDDVWGEIENTAGMSRREYTRYVDGAQRIMAIRLRDPIRLEGALDLKTIRNSIGSFHPPQFAKRLTNDGGLLRLLKRVQEGH